MERESAMETTHYETTHAGRRVEAGTRSAIQAPRRWRRRRSGLRLAARRPGAPALAWHARGGRCGRAHCKLPARREL